MSMGVPTMSSKHISSLVVLALNGCRLLLENSVTLFFQYYLHNLFFQYLTRVYDTSLQATGTQPDIIHVHEWQIGALPLLYWDMYHYLSLKVSTSVIATTSASYA